MKNWILLMSLLVMGLITGCGDKEPGKPHVFLIYVDDLRPELGVYGNQLIKSPNIDALGKDAVVFNNAYATIPVCGASRASMLTGVMPNRNRFVGYQGHAENEVPYAVTLPQHLKDNGYRTLSLGKVFHKASDSEHAWSQPPYKGQKKTNKDYALQLNIDSAKNHPRKRAGFFEMADTTDEAYLDGKLAKKAIEMLQKDFNPDQPLFMAVGFHKPHLPFTPPKKYWDLYEPAELPYPENYYTPENAPENSIHNFGELRSYTDIPDDKDPLDSSLVRKLIHGYYASVSYTDTQIGKFIDKLKSENLYDESIIILVGDHGWFLGEHTMWCKHSTYTDALRTPLMIKFPNSVQQGHTDLPVGLVELYPSLVDMIGIEAPSTLHAVSFLDQLEETPEFFKNKEIYCRYMDGETLIKGYYVYTEFYNDEGINYASMLYDHASDSAENVNVVDQVDPSIVTGLSKNLSTHINKYK